MSIVRVGLAETDGFSDGYDRIFGKKQDDKAEQPRSQEAQQSQTASKPESNQPAK
jgi:hypothetical protein